MIGRLKIGLLAIVLLLLNGCHSIHEDLDDCGITLQFVYDYNMEYTCSFKRHVGTVDVYVFDSEGKFVLSRRADCQSELLDGNKMYINEGLEPGEYKILTVGGLCEKFQFIDAATGVYGTPRVSTIEDVRLSLKRESTEVSHEFPAIWFGETVTVNYPSFSENHLVHLVKNTNQFNLALYRQDAEENETPSGTSPLYTFEVVTPEGAVYGHQNQPLSNDTVKYMPYSLTAGVTSNSYSVGRINSVRLLDNLNTRADREDSGYRLVVRNLQTFKEVWNIDLLELLRELKSTETNADGSPLGMQEYLDRKSIWDISILHRGGGPGDEHDTFLAVAIKIGPWIKWFHDMPMD